LFNTPDRPVQILFAGKAHPRDNDGKSYIHKIIDLTHDPRFFGKVIFIENYDIDVARHLVSGCDLWLNTPRRPLEASGTSGQKVAINCGLHASVLDGWWLEGYSKKNGWAIGDKKSNQNQEEQDRSDSEYLYRLMHEEIFPEFYQRDTKGVPRKWVARIRSSLRSIIPVFNTHRMVMEYATKYYFPQ
jgi:starch phosphorylase